jgi:hypothetical protein
MKRAARRAMLAYVLAAMTGRLDAAQVQTGSILVRAVDEQGGILPGVVVTIASPALVAGQMTGVTDAGGIYRFVSLPPGVYSVRLELAGFQTLVRENVIVSVGITTPLELTLRVASVQETVTVRGESPTVDTTSANVSVLLDQRLLQSTPGGRDIWSLVEYKVPGLVTTRPDVGGAAGGLQGGFTARGTPNSQNVQFLNGINVGDPAAIGFTGFYYDYDAFEEIQVSTGAHDLSVPSAGVFLNMVTKTGGDRFSGKASAFWQGNATQSRNVDERLLAFGFRPDAGAVKFVSDANFQLGGPVVRNKLRFFTSVRDWRVHVNVPGFPEVESTDMTSGLLNVTWQPVERHRLTAFYARQYYDKPNRGASAFNTPESNFKEDDVFDITQGLWNAVLSNRAFLDARVTFNRIFFPLFQKGRDQSLFDQATSVLTRAAQQEQIFERRRLQANANFNYFVERALGGRHELRFGVDHAHTPTRTDVNRIDDLNLFWNSALGRGTEVVLFNSPVRSRATVDTTALFAQDSYTVGRLTAIGGVRWERVEGYLPEQSSPPSRWFPDLQRQFAAIRNIIHWNTVGPRLSLAYDVRGDGKTALKAAAGRYYYTIGTGTPNAVNPNFTVSERYVWNDLNGDLRFQPGELGRLLARTGGLTTSYDADLKRPHTDEISLGLDRELMPDVKLSAVFTYRMERDNFGSHNVGVPFSAYTAVTRVDPGRDGVVGTPDDNPNFVVYNQDPATLGRDRFLITNNPLLDQKHRDLELTLTKRFSRRWQLLAGYTIARTEIQTDSVVNPNALINNRGPIALDRTHIVKMTASYLFPGDWMVSGNVRAQSGAPVTRTVRFSLNQGTVTVNAEPRGSERLDPLVTLDARIAKIFRVRGREVELMLDGHNLTNANTVWDVRTLTGVVRVRRGGDPQGELVEHPQYRSPVQILPPRILRLGVSYRF